MLDSARLRTNTPNMITLARVIFLPIPCWLLYGDDRSKVVAVALFGLLAVTDWIDGYLARLWGGTKLGALLDPIADKIFIAALFVPCADLGMFPLSAVIVILLREFAVTALRSALLLRGIDFQTSEFAKHKTFIQMLGALLLILAYVFREGPLIHLILGSLALLAVVLTIRDLRRVRRVTPRVMSALLCFGELFLARLFLEPEPFITLNVFIIAGVTVASGLKYFFDARAPWREQGSRARPTELAIFLLGGVVTPILYVGTMFFEGAVTWAVVVFVSLELSLGVLDNMLKQSGTRPDERAQLIKVIIQTAVGAAVVFLLNRGNPESIQAARLSLLVVLGATFLYTVATVVAHRDAIELPGHSS